MVLANDSMYIPSKCRVLPPYKHRSTFFIFLAGRHRGRLQSEVDPRTAIDSAGSLPVGVDRRGNSFRSDRTSGRLLRGGPHNASGSDMTDDSISVVSAPPGPLGNK